MARSYCFTLNMMLPEHHEAIYDFQMASLPHLKYAVWQLEIGPECGTLHWQGYMSFSKTVRMAQMHAIWPRMSMRVAKASEAVNFVYCSKERTQVEGPFTIGRMSKPGERSDLLRVKDKIDAGMSINDKAVWSEEDYATVLRNHRGFQVYERVSRPPRTEKTEVHVRYGDPATGKSRFVMDSHPAHEVFIKAFGKWFDGYAGEPVVLFDEFEGDMPLGALKQLLDRYKAQAEIKNGFVNWAPKIIYITSNTKPEDWYPNADDKSVQSMFRKFTTVTHFVRDEDGNVLQRCIAGESATYKHDLSDIRGREWKINY